MKFLHAVAPVAAVAATVVAAPSYATEVRPFNTQAFAAARGQGRPILVNVYPDWCPTCRREEPLVAELITVPAYRDLIVFKLNFGEQKEDSRRLGVRRQSALIAFDGRIETAQSVEDTNRDAIVRLICSRLG